MNQNQRDVLQAVTRRWLTAAQIAARCGKSPRSVATTLCVLRGLGSVTDNQLVSRHSNGAASSQPPGPVKWKLEIKPT